MSTFGYSMSTHCPALSAPMYSTNSTLWSPQAARSIWVRVERSESLTKLPALGLWGAEACGSLSYGCLISLVSQKLILVVNERSIPPLLLDKILGVDNLFSENDIKTKKQNHTDTPLPRTCPLGQKIHPFWDFGPRAVTRLSLSEDSGYNRAPWHSSR